MINGVSQVNTESHTWISTGNSGRNIVLTSTGIITLNINDEVELAVNNETDNTAIVIEHANLTIFRVDF